MEEEKRTSIAVIKRLPRYYRYLGDLMDNDIKKTSSKELSKIMNITASQIRQDLNNFGCFGQQGYGYDVHSLYLEIKKILGINQPHNMILIGVGNIGQALANYGGFRNRGFKFTAAFDKDKDMIGKKVGGIQVFDIDTLSDYLSKNEVDIAVLTAPKASVYDISKVLSKHKIKGIWNFSSVDLEYDDEDAMVENIHLTDSLMTLSYRLNEREIIKNLRGH